MTASDVHEQTIYNYEGSTLGGEGCGVGSKEYVGVWNTHYRREKLQNATYASWMQAPNKRTNYGVLETESQSNL